MEDKRNYCVYCHTAPNGKKYVGLTSRRPEERWKNGYGYKKSNPHFWNAIKKYGWENIKHDILLSRLDKQQAGEFEKMYICLFNSSDRKYGYNKTFGGETGGKPTEEIILKISGANHWMAKRIEQYSLKGEYIKTFDCVSSAAKALNVDYGSIASCARHDHYTAFGYIWIYEDDPEKEKWIIEDVRDRTHGKNNSRAKKIIQYDLNGNLVKIYSCLTEASNETQTHISRISDCANGKRFTTGGFIWLFEDDKNIEEKLREKIKEKRHPSAMCGGANHQARAIEQYSLNGEYIRTYSSAQEASEILGIDYSSIKSAANLTDKHHKSSGGFIWVNADTVNKKEIIKARMNKGCEKPISQYTVDGKHIRDFSSITEAKLFLNTRSNIGECVRGKRKTACGYIWKYA